MVEESGKDIINCNGDDNEKAIGNVELVIDKSYEDEKIDGTPTEDVVVVAPPFNEDGNSDDNVQKDTTSNTNVDRNVLSTDETGEESGDRMDSDTNSRNSNNVQQDTIMNTNVNMTVLSAGEIGAEGEVMIDTDNRNSVTINPSNNNNNNNITNDTTTTPTSSNNVKKRNYRKKNTSRSVDKYSNDFDDDNSMISYSIWEQQESLLNRPKNTKMSQQNLESWQPILDPIYVIATMFLCTCIILPLGYYIQSLSREVIELKITYDGAYSGQQSEKEEICGINTTVRANKTCTLTFLTPQEMLPPILIHYEIDNFHQNHRDYYKSLDVYQLGDGRLSKDQDQQSANGCHPLNKLGDIYLNPCGFRANTLFNDIFTLRSVLPPPPSNLSGENPTFLVQEISSETTLPTNTTTTSTHSTINNTQSTSSLSWEVIEEGIAWTSDRDYIYRQPQGFCYEPCPVTPILDSNTTNTTTTNDDGCDLSCCEPSVGATTNCITNNGTAGQTGGMFEATDIIPWSCLAKNRGPYYDSKNQYNATHKKCYRYYYPDENTTQYLYETYPEVIHPLEGVENEHFMVWMRIATLPKFRKLYGYIDTAIPANSTIVFDVTANYVVESFHGKKSLLLSTTNKFGGKNEYMGRSFILMGYITLVIALFFTFQQIFRPRKLGDFKYLHYKED